MSDVKENDNTQSEQDDSFPTISSAPSAKELGSKIGPYKLLSVLGEGGFGVVYLAEQERPIKRRVALKVIKPGMDTKQVIARFEGERQALALLDHPNIAHVFDAGTTEAGRPYFVMEHVKGISITEHCDKQKLNIEERLELFQQACEAIQHAHQKGIIHRDIKPSNILVSVQDGKAVPMIIDFGVAKAMSQPLTEQTLFTEQGQMIGTPEYMSPEQAEMSVQEIDTRSDIYSLGVVLYELLTGTLPFDTKTFREVGIDYIRQIIREQEPKTPSTRLSSLGDKAREVAERRHTDIGTLTKLLHKELEWIPLKAMRKESSRRYRSASELADDIRNYLDGAPLIAGPESASYRLKKAISRNRALVTGIAAVLVVLIAGIVVSTIFAFGSIRAQKAEENQRIKAVQALKEAEQAKLNSEKQKENAIQARTEAEQARKEAEKRAEELRVASYYDRIHLAAKELDDGEFYSASSRLENCPTDLLGWEGYYLVRILNSAGATYYAKGGPASFRADCISPTGHVALRTLGGPDTMRIWDIGTLSEVLIPRGFSRSSYTMAAALSRDGSRFACGDDEGIIRVWNTKTGSCVATITYYDEKAQSTGSGAGATLASSRAKRIRLVALSPDGRRVVLSGPDRRTVIWDVNTGNKLAVLSDKEIFSSIVYSPDGERLLTVGPSSLKVWSATGTELVSLSVHILDVTWSVDGQVIAYYTGESIGICEATTGRNMTEFPAKIGWSAIAISPDNKYVVSGGMDGMVRVWEVASGTQVSAVRRHGVGVQSVAFDSDGSRIISLDQFGTICVWKFPMTDTSQARIIDLGIDQSDELYDEYYTVAFNPDRRQVAVLDPNTLTILDVENGMKSKIFDVNGPRSICTIAFSPDGKYIGASDLSGAKIWDSETGGEVLNIESAKSIAFGPGGKYVIAGGWSELEMWNLAEGTRTKTFSLGQDINRAMCVAFDPEGKRIAVGGGQSIIVLDLGTGANKLTLQVPNLVINTVEFDSGGKRLVSRHDLGIVRIWDAETGESLAVCRHGSNINDVVFSPDGTRILSSGRNGLIRIWDANTGAEVLTLDAPDVEEVSFSYDGQRILAFCGDTIKVWDSGSENKTMVAAYLHERGSFHNREANFVELRLFHKHEGNFDMAISLLDRAIRLERKNPQTWYQRGLAYFEKREYSKAIADFNEAIELVSNNTSFWQKRAETYCRNGQYGLAIVDYSKALEIQTDTPSVLNSLAWLYATCAVDEFRNGQKAVEFATRVCELTDWVDVDYVNTLAAAYAEVGDFETAIKWQKTTINQVANKRYGGRSDPEYESRLELYEAGEPYRENP